jgi:hypothetical protein
VVCKFQHFVPHHPVCGASERDLFNLPQPPLLGEEGKTSYAGDMQQQQRRRRPPNPRNLQLEEDPFLEWLAWLMDQSIKVGPWSIGLDGFLGLIPGVGDITGGAVSAYIIARAMQTGVPNSVIIRMIINVAIDSLLGSIPLVGDIFDFAFKANVKNVQMYRESLKGSRHAAKDWSFIALVFVLLAVIIMLPILGLIYLGRLLGPYLPTF